MLRRAAGILAQCFSFLILSCLTCNALSFHANLTPIKVDSEPGAVVNAQYTMTLGTEQPQTQFHLFTQDFYRSEDGKQSFYKPAGTLSHSCANWIAINPIEATILPGGELNARLTINVPNDAKPGGYWCVLTVNEVPDPHRVTPRGVGMQFLTSISVGVYVNVLPVVKSVKIEDIAVADNCLNIKVTDTGNCPFSADGHVEFLKPDDKTAFATAALPKTALFCEPIGKAILSADLPDEKTMPSGHYTVRVILDIGLDHYIGVQKEMDINRVPETPRK